LNIEFRTAEVFESKETMFFTSIFCGSLFCGSAVHILKDMMADSFLLSADQGDWIRFCSAFQVQPKTGFVLP
jgi:hypothetical protein